MLHPESGYLLAVSLVRDAGGGTGVGVAALTLLEGEAPSGLMRRADVALYGARRRGRGLRGVAPPLTQASLDATAGFRAYSAASAPSAVAAR